MQESKHRNLFEVILFSGFLLILVYFYRPGLFFSSFNLDEVILTLSSQDIKVQDYALNKEAVGNFFDVFSANRTYGSLDPGFFTLILHLWSKVSHNTWWLRLLPFSFFLGGLVVVISTLRHLGKKAMPLKLALFPLFLFFSNQVILDHAYTIRPYAMEMMGTAFLFFVISKLEWKADKSNYLLMLGLSFFLGSRYFFWINCSLALVSIFVVDFIKKEVNISSFIKLILIPICMMIFLLIFVFQYQYENLDTRYMHIYYDNSRSWWKELLGDHSFKFFLSYPLYLLINHLNKKKLSQTQMKITLFLALSLCSYVLANYLKISPMRVHERFTIGFHTMALISFSLMIREIIEVIRDSNEGLATFLCLFSLVFCFNSQYLFEQKSELIPMVKYMEDKLSEKNKVYCDVISCSMVRFLKDFVGYESQWNAMPEFVPYVEGIKPSEDSYFLVIAPTGNLGELGLELERRNLPLVQGHYYQRLYRNE